MSVSLKQIKANQANAVLSTGPCTEAGKDRSKMNAVQHGLFSQHLFLEDEETESYFSVGTDLYETLRPLGALEEMLVERILVSMWRQRRLIQAETAILDLERSPREIARATSREFFGVIKHKINEKDLVPVDENELQWCETVLQEYQNLSDFSIEELKSKAPHIYVEFCRIIDGEEKIAEHLSEFTEDPKESVNEIVEWCQQKIKTATQRSPILATAQKIRNKMSLLPEIYLDLLSRYQTNLDNQLYKAMKALKETQEWRSERL